MLRPHQQLSKQRVQRIFDPFNNDRFACCFDLLLSTCCWCGWGLMNDRTQNISPVYSNHTHYQAALLAEKLTEAEAIATDIYT